jgi:uncharacterized protein (DUF302 family)
MVHESGTVTFMVPAPFEKALGLIRQALNERDLGIAAELDISGRISQKLGIDLIPSRVLCVDHPQLLRQAMAFGASAATLLPLHIVVSGTGSRTLVHLLSQTSIYASGIAAGAKAAVSKLQVRISSALETIAVREGFTRLIA